MLKQTAQQRRQTMITLARFLDEGSYAAAYAWATTYLAEADNAIIAGLGLVVRTDQLRHEESSCFSGAAIAWLGAVLARYLEAGTPSLALPSFTLNTLPDAYGATRFLRCAHCHALYLPHAAAMRDDGRTYVYWTMPPTNPGTTCQHVDTGIQAWNGVEWVATSEQERKE